MMDRNLELWAKIIPFFTKLFLVRVFYHSNINETRTLFYSIYINVPFVPKDTNINYSDRKQENGCLGVGEAVGRVGKWGSPRAVIITFASGVRYMLSSFSYNFILVCISNL